MKYIHILLISCLLLCSCPFEEEEELENTLLSSSSSVALPSSSSVEPAEPSILDCPLEDLENIGKYPVPESDPPPPPLDEPDKNYAGYCRPSSLELSVEELSFNVQGGVRCVTSRSLMAVNAFGKDGVELGCYKEMIVRFPDGSTFTGTGREFSNVPWKFKKLACPWFTATAVDIWSEGRRTLHISVNQNETRNERETSVGISMGNCGAGFKIIQAPN